MARPSRFSLEVRDRAVRMVLEHENEHASQWAAITSIAEKIGCAAETLRSWVRQAERDQGQRPGLTTEERQRLKQLERIHRGAAGDPPRSLQPRLEPHGGPACRSE
jgi:transposase